ncbi:hypothetical protein CG747_29470 [Streptomyces sp. CB02959]|nr:hypothetical protein CG747_29470 [Streptomyces sp. CB02959]
MEGQRPPPRADHPRRLRVPGPAAPGEGVPARPARPEGLTGRGRPAGSRDTVAAAVPAREKFFRPGGNPAPGRTSSRVKAPQGATVDELEQPTVNPSRTARTSRTAGPRLRRSAGAGLLAAIALTAVATTGTAYAADPSPVPTQPPGHSATPSPVPSHPGHGGSPSPVPTHPGHGNSPSPAPSYPPGHSATPSPVPSKPGSKPGSNPAPAPAGGDDKQLAKTGASSGTTLALGGGAAALIAAGGGALYAVRRNRA